MVNGPIFCCQTSVTGPVIHIHDEGEDTHVVFQPNHAAGAVSSSGLGTVLDRTLIHAKFHRPLQRSDNLKPVLHNTRPKI